MKIKSIKHIKGIVLGVILLMHQGCGDDILTQTPDHVISETLVVNSVDRLQDLLTGAYNEVSSSRYLGRILYKRAAVKGTDFRYVQTTFNPRNYELTEYRYEESSNNNGSAQSLWEQCFKVISSLNLILDNIDHVEGNDSDKQQIKAEALALRGMTYFDLARTFAYPWIKEGAGAQGLPLNLTSKEVVIERSTLGKTYDQIILDMTSALGIINNSLEQGGTKYITRTGIHALLARIYLYKQDWENALSFSKEVLAVKDESDLMNVDTYVFDDFTSESLFEISITSDNSVGSNGLGAQFDFGDGGQGDVIATQTFIDLLQTYQGDPRAGFLTEDKEGNTAAFVKYINRSGGGGLSIHNIPVIRLSEIYLIAAEACANGATGGDAQALAYLNVLINKRTTNFELDKATESGSALKTRITHERRRELALEGHGVYDYIRTGTDINRPESEHVNTGVNVNNLNVPATSPKTIYPIPASEIEASQMEQTDGY